MKNGKQLSEKNVKLSKYRVHVLFEDIQII